MFSSASSNVCSLYRTVPEWNCFKKSEKREWYLVTVHEVGEDVSIARGQAPILELSRDFLKIPPSLEQAHVEVQKGPSSSLAVRDGSTHERPVVSDPYPLPFQLTVNYSTTVNYCNIYYIFFK